MFQVLPIKLQELSIAQIPLGSSRHVSTWLDTFDVWSRAVRQARHSQNASMAQHVERVVSRRVESSGIWAYDL